MSTTELTDIFVHQAPFGIKTIKEIIPHRFPFLLIDGITILGDRHVEGYKMLSASDQVFEGHFPSEPVYPGVLQIETMAQAGACWILNRRENIGKIAYLMTVENAKFRRPAIPGMRLDIRGDITSYRGRFGKLEAEITSDGEVVSSATVLFAFQKGE